MVDALLWLGPTSTEAPAPPGIYDEAYLGELRFRAQIMKQVYGVDFSEDIDEAARP